MRFNFWDCITYREDAGIMLSQRGRFFYTGGGKD